MSTTTETLGYFPCWILIQQAPDVAGCWVAHCLEYDVVSFGESLQHALEMIREATAMVLTEDLADGRNPHERRAPAACWAPLKDVLTNGTRMSIGDVEELNQKKPVLVAVQLIAKVERVHAEVEPEPYVPWFLLERPTTEPAYC